MPFCIISISWSDSKLFRLSDGFFCREMVGTDQERQNTGEGDSEDLVKVISYTSENVSSPELIRLNLLIDYRCNDHRLRGTSSRYLPDRFPDHRLRGTSSRYLPDRFPDHSLRGTSSRYLPDRFPDHRLRGTSSRYLPDRFHRSQTEGTSSRYLPDRFHRSQTPWVSLVAPWVSLVAPWVGLVAPGLAWWPP
jgi:hypothetical protein